MTDRVLFTDEQNKKLREQFRYANRERWAYSCLITFKQTTDFANLHPFKAYKLFTKTFKPYLTKRDINFVCFPEISKTGRFHCHLMVGFPPTDNSYAEHERQLRLYKSWIVRKFGEIHTEQRILNLFGPYKDESFKYVRSNFETTFEEKWKYMSKDRNQYIELQNIHNKQP